MRTVMKLLLFGGGIDYNNYLKSLASGLIGLWPLTDLSGSALDISGNNFHGSYDADAVKAGETFALGNPIVRLLGNGAVGLPVASLDTLLNWEEYSVILWLKMPVANWADSNIYTMLFIGSTGTTQRIQMRKNSTPGELTVLADTGTALLSVVEASVITPDWIQLAITNSKIANAMKFFVNRNQAGTTQTGVGTDDGSALLTAAVGATESSGATQGVVGATGYAALYYGTILTQAQIQASYDYVASNYNSGTNNVIGSGDSTWTGESLTTSKLIPGLGAGWGFVREMGVSGATSTSWKTGIDAVLAATSFNRDPFVVITCIGKNDMAAMPSQATFEANVAYVWDAFHVKWPSMKIIYESPWRSGQDANSNLIKGYLANVAATRSWVSLGTDETDYFRTAELATPGSYSSDGIHINTAAGTTARAALLAASIAAL